MATYYIIAAGAPVGTVDPGNVNGYPQVNAGTITAQPGDVYVVDNGFNANTVIQFANGQTGTVEVQFNQSITGLTATNQGSISFYPGVNATVNIAAGVDADPVQIVASSAQGLTVNAAANATVGQITGSAGVDTVTAGNGVTLNGLVMGDSTTANVTVGNDVTFNTQVTLNASDTAMNLTAGDRATFNCSITMSGNNMDKTVTLGESARINGSVNLSGDGTSFDMNTTAFVAGNSLTVTGNVAQASNYAVNEFRVGTNATIGSTIDLHSNYSDNTVVLGSGATVGSSIILTSNYSDNDLKIGNNSIVGSSGVGSISMNSNNAENCLAIGSFVTVKGNIDLGSNLTQQLVRIGDNLTVSNSLVFGGTNSSNGVEIGTNLSVGGSITGSNNPGTGVQEYIQIGDGWYVVGQINMAGGNDNLVLGAPAANETSQVISADGAGGNGASIEAPVGQEAAFSTAATAAGWRQNSDGSWSPTAANQNFTFNNSNYQFLWFDKAVDTTAAPNFNTCTIFVTPNGKVEGTAGDDSMAAPYTDPQGDQIDGTDGLNDTIVAGGGNDTVLGGAGDDSISGDGETPLPPVQNALVTFANSDNLQDSTAVEANGIRAVELVRLADGKLIMITSENGGSTDGIASYRIDSDPNSPTFGQIMGTTPTSGGTGDLSAKISSLSEGVSGAGFDNIQSMEAATLANGNSFVFTADVARSTIGIARIGADGSLTAGPSLTAPNLDAVQSLSFVTVGGTPVLLAYAGGTSDSLMSFAVNPATGALTLLDRETDGSGTGENFLGGGTGESPSFVEGFTNSAGQTFVLAAGNDGAQNGISLYTLDATGQLTFQNARGDDQNGASETDPQGNSLGRDIYTPAGSQTGLDDSAAATWAEIGGKTYVFVGGNDDDVTIFRVDPDAKGDGTFDLTLVGQIDDYVVDISTMVFIPSGTGGTLVVGGETSELRYAAVTVDPTTGVVTLVDPLTHIVDDAPEPGAEIFDSEDLAYVDGVLVSGTDDDDGVAVMTAKFTTFTPAGTTAGVAGADSLSGGDGNDTLAGNAGNDTLSGGAGNDSLAGEEGDDSLSGDAGNDTLDGGAGNDSLAGGGGNDSASGGDGADTLLGGAGNDTVNGGAGDDDIALGGADSASGGTGDDVFTLDATDTAADIAASIDGGTDGTQGAGDDTSNGNAGDVLDLSAGSAAQTVIYGTNPKGGTVNGLDADAGVDITFAEIERLLTGTGSDSINGASATGAIWVDSGAGNDTLFGGSGNDTLAAGTGNDSIASGTGDDTVDAGEGDDTIDAGAGNDTLIAGAGNDSLIASTGNDSIDGGSGDDIVSSGTGNDSVLGGDGNDTLAGNENNDSLSGGTGNDSLDGGSEDDTLDGGAGSDTLVGGTGNDSLTGDVGDDRLQGGLGNDTALGGDGSDTLSGNENNDLLDGGAGNDSLDGGSEDDTLSGGDGLDTLVGGTGEDSLGGGLGNDTLRGGIGNDILFGDEGDDTLSGNEDNDQLYGGIGSDSVDGGSGNDVVDGGDGADTLKGGVGNDTLLG
ncbi:beta strand repeat-containing protein, partial [Paragemmobacter straminiformis]